MNGEIGNEKNALTGRGFTPTPQRGVVPRVFPKTPRVRTYITALASFFGIPRRHKNTTPCLVSGLFFTTTALCRVFFPKRRGAHIYHRTCIFLVFRAVHKHNAPRCRGFTPQQWRRVFSPKTPRCAHISPHLIFLHSAAAEKHNALFASGFPTPQRGVVSRFFNACCI